MLEEKPPAPRFRLTGSLGLLFFKTIFFQLAKLRINSGTLPY